jgi:S-formylglutathione hydrolase FrmB
MARVAVVVAVFAVAFGAAAAVRPSLVGLGSRTRYHTTDGARVRAFPFHSRLLRRTLHEVAVVPRGRRGRPLLVLLHGRSMPPNGLLSDAFFRELRRLGPRAPVVLFPDGGDHSYWHNRRDGPWGSYVLREAIPDAILRFDADGSRVAIGGVSMGGFGALDLARLAPQRFCAVGAHSAALWLTGGSTPAGAFDDAADFARHDVISSPFPFHGPVWIDVGRSDPFLASDGEFAAAHHLRFHVWPGGHGDSYWAKHLRAYVRFYAQALHSCR